MTKVIYRVVEHDGGWAYQLDGAFSETFDSHDQARGAAERAAREQRVSGEEAAIAYEHSEGRWYEELVQGFDRPDTEVEG